jgi:cobalt/nickel transport system permease protein
VSGSHGVVDPDRLHRPGDSPVHRLDAAAKLVGLVAFVVLVAVTPREAVIVPTVAAATLTLVAWLAEVPARTVLTRLAAIAPFVAFAVFVPVIGTGHRVDVVGISLSTDGLWACWGIIAKAVLGATAGILTTATTSLPELLRGLRRLHVPPPVVSIVAVMLRYLSLVTEQLVRLRRAMTARGHDPRWIWQVRPIASSVGTLFVRTYERGERVHLAMVARGYDGELPGTAAPTTTTAVASVWALVPAFVTAASLVAWTILT